MWVPITLVEREDIQLGTRRKYTRCKARLRRQNGAAGYPYNVTTIPDKDSPVGYSMYTYPEKFVSAGRVYHITGVKPMEGAFYEADYYSDIPAIDFNDAETWKIETEVVLT